MVTVACRLTAITDAFGYSIMTDIALKSPAKKEDGWSGIQRSSKSQSTSGKSILPLPLQSNAAIGSFAAIHDIRLK